MDKIISLLLISLIIILIVLSKSRINSNECNEVNRNQKNAMELGINYIHSIKKIKNEFNNPSVMFDIDDTLIDSQSGKLIKPIVKLLNKCSSEGYGIVIITARDSKFSKETESELYTKGIYYDILFLRNPKYDDFYTFKSKIKKKLSENDIDIVMSIGDNLHDISGDYSGYSIKLPNYEDPRLFHLNNKGKMEQVC